MAPEMLRDDMKNRDEADAMITARVVSFSFPAESGVLRVEFMFS